MEVVIISGMSGAGKTKAADWFEDQGYYCVDNMPPNLIKNFIDLVRTNDKRINKAAFVVDIRGGRFFDDLGKVIAELKARADIKLSLLFIDASNEAIVRRYMEARRNHPLHDEPANMQTIEEEREILQSLRENADFVVDTSNLKTAAMNAELANLFLGGKKEKSFVVSIMSFGFKKGIPLETDWVFDMRFIENPYYVKSLKKLTGRSKKVSQFVLSKDSAQKFLAKMTPMLLEMIPQYIEQGKYSMTIACGCTGGHHRSVAMAEEFARRFFEAGYSVTLEHRDL